MEKIREKKNRYIFYHIRNTRFYQSSQVTPNPDKTVLEKSQKSQKITFFYKDVKLDKVAPVDKRPTRDKNGYPKQL